MALKLNDRYLNSFVAEHELTGIAPAVKAAHDQLVNRNGLGSDFLGWVHLPSSITPDRIEAIEKQAAKLREKAEVIICIGIGGSYLGAKAVLEAMSDSFKFLHKKRTEPVVVFAGQNISEDYTHELLEAVKEYSIATIVISKSGTTTEPAIAFRLIKAEIEKRYGKQEAAERIVAITDKARGALKTLATQEGYPTFVIPDDVGGRFSVLTPVGLLPLAVGKGRCAATEILVGTDAVANLIREGKCYQIPSILQSGAALGMHSLNADLARLVSTGRITREAAERCATNKSDLKNYL